MNKLETLPPCPFCGELYGENHKDDCYISLMRENLVALLSGWEHAPITIEEMQEAWNKRNERTCKLWSALSHQDHSMKYTCMECHHVAAVIENGGLMEIAELKKRIPNYCPNCGAKVINEN